MTALALHLLNLANLFLVEMHNLALLALLLIPQSNCSVLDYSAGATLLKTSQNHCGSPLRCEASPEGLSVWGQAVWRTEVAVLPVSGFPAIPCQPAIQWTVLHRQRYAAVHSLDFVVQEHWQIMKSKWRVTSCFHCALQSSLLLCSASPVDLLHKL